MEITKLPNGNIHINQPSYVRSLLETLALKHAYGRKTPYSNSMMGPPTEGDQFIDTCLGEHYRKSVGEIRWLTDCTRPDLAFIAGMLASATSQLTVRHWNMLKLTGRYLMDTCMHGLTYFSKKTTPRHPAIFLCSYSDSDFAADESDRKSTTGSIHSLFASPISWASHIQSISALSTCEAEYQAATSTVQNTELLRRLLQFMQILPHGPTIILLDNNAAIAAATNTAPTRKRKFLQLRHH